MKKFIHFILLVTITSSCSERHKIENKVFVRIKKFPASLNYLISSSSESSRIQNNIFNSLYIFNKDGNATPSLALDMPNYIKADGNLILKFNIINSSKWSNGIKIKANDILFSAKIIKLPIPVNINSRIYFERLKKIENINDTLHAYTSGTKEEVTALIADFNILQKSKYDPLDLLGHITFDDIENNPEKVAKDEKVIRFVDEFLKDNFKFKGEYLGGSGAYIVSKIENGRYIHLKKNPNWWGLKVSNKLQQFNANPDEIIYQNIPEPIIAIQALKAQSIDVMDDIPASEFAQLINDESFLENYNLFTPLKYKFTYIGLNTRLKYLDNIKLRTALAHLIKAEDMINVVEKGYGEKTVGPINPANKYYYNNNINQRLYNPKKAQNIFLNNGFELIDDKLVNKLTHKPLEFNVSYRQNPGYESIAYMLKQEASKIGIKLKLKQYEGRTISKMAKNHRFEIMIGAFNGNPNSLNFSGLFSQEAAKINGMNFTGFGNTMTDSLMQAANYAIDSTSKQHALYAFQEELHKEATMFFLYFSKNKIAINKKFDNLKISTTKPGYDVSSFILKNASNSN